MIFDASLTPEQVFAQNPDRICPEEVLAAQRLLEVTYYGFDRQLHAGQIVVALTVVDDIKELFELIKRERFPIEKVIPAAAPQYEWNDDALMADNVTSGFNYRTIAGSDQPSPHGLGLAIDINPVQNPYIRYVDEQKIVAPAGSLWTPGQIGTLEASHAVVRFVEARGWEWGGHWTPESGRTDYQHFQKSTDARIVQTD